MDHLLWQQRGSQEEETVGQQFGGSIANINADGTFTHVVVEEDDDH